MPAPIKIAVLDDYQRNAGLFANWSNLEPAAKTLFFHDNISDIDQLVARLEPFAVVIVIRERTRFSAELISRLPNLKLIATIGMANAAIDLAAARAHHVVVCGTEGMDLEATPVLTWASRKPTSATTRRTALTMRSRLSARRSSICWVRR